MHDNRFMQVEEHSNMLSVLSTVALLAVMEASRQYVALVCVMVQACKEEHAVWGPDANKVIV